MPRADGMKFHYLDHDTYQQDLTPPVQNTWYEVFDEVDVRHLWCVIYQTNDETLAKDMEVRWTIDGNVYFRAFSANNATDYYVYRDEAPSGVGTAGLSASSTIRNAAAYVDKRGHSYKVEFRITSPLGTNQRIRCRCVIETLELT